MRKHLLLLPMLLTFGCDTGSTPTTPTAPDGPRWSNDIDVFLDGVEPNPVTVGERAMVTVRLTAPYAAEIYGRIQVTPPGELVRVMSAHFPSGETEYTLSIYAHKAGEWKVRLRSAHDPYPNDADIQVGSPRELAFMAVEP